jgi:cytochrome c biogenesis protein CcmG/thiol:disulfide interchange protein DsbE
MNWRRSMLGLAAGLPLLGLLSWGLTRDASLVPSPLPGRPAPEFALPTLDGQDTVRLADLRGDVVVVNFWASWCVACRIEHRDLSDAARLYAGRNVKFYGLLFRDSPVNGARWIEQMGGQSYPSLVDQNSRTGVGYGITAVPETFVIGPDGVVAYKHIGPIRLQDLAAVIDPLLGGEAAPR